jgi:glycosyltransferase involved in cell wall biosynthesis
MKVTVAMPAFNAERYIDDAIESVLAQNCRSFELVVIDDASTDGTWRRLRRYTHDSRVRVYRHRRNLGAGATRNALTALARGRYVTPCDADDLLLPGALHRLSRYLDRHPRVGVVYADILEVLLDDRGRVVRAPSLIGQDPRTAWDLVDNVVNHAGSMIRRSLMVQVGGYDETVYSVDDWSLWLKLSEVSRVAYLRGEIYYLWRRHPTSLTQTDPRWHADVAKIRADALRRRYGIINGSTPPASANRRGRRR